MAVSLRKQPIVRLMDRSTYGHEILLAHPKDTLGLMADAGLLVDLDRYIVDTALHLARTQQTRVFVNVTAELLATQHLPFAPDDDLTGLVLEITERSRLDIEAVASYLAPYREHGLRIALDDFGNGFNGLLRWTTLRPDFVKVRLSSGMEFFLPLIMDAAAQLEAELVVERVETHEQDMWLKKLGVTYGQGFFYGRPVPMEGGAA
ncbi:EAL domain-containing protein [Alicyclobacillus acidocaldarius]|uniref:EAL domain-containing protein n=1 Tax=Alicyclobacillus acidocaldarius TaxID=405212 RepID=UPI00019DDD7E|nr:EAL domain-containing protein [Alicyclobacillus acidocaldarius]